MQKRSSADESFFNLPVVAGIHKKVFGNRKNVFSDIFMEKVNLFEKGISSPL
jgi:hypothetical protein